METLIQIAGIPGWFRPSRVSSVQPIKSDYGCEVVLLTADGAKFSMPQNDYQAAVRLADDIGQHINSKIRGAELREEAENQSGR